MGLCLQGVEVASLGNIYLPLVEGQGPMQALRRAPPKTAGKAAALPAAAAADSPRLQSPAQPMQKRPVGRPKCVCPRGAWVLAAGRGGGRAEQEALCVVG